MYRGAQNTSNSGVKNHWLQITITNTIIMKIFKILQELPKCNRDMKWASVGKMALLHLLSAGLPQTFSLLKKKKIQYLQGTIKQSTTGHGMPVHFRAILPVSAQSLLGFLLGFLFNIFSPSFLTLWFVVLQYFGKVLCHYVFKYFFL